MRATALLAADGTDSTVRRLLALPVAGHRYEQTAVVTHVQSSKPHDGTAWQRFLPGGPLALLPLQDGSSSLVWSLPTERAQALLARVRLVLPERRNDMHVGRRREQIVKRFRNPPRPGVHPGNVRRQEQDALGIFADARFGFVERSSDEVDDFGAGNFRSGLSEPGHGNNRDKGMKCLKSQI